MIQLEKYLVTKDRLQKALVVANCVGKNLTNPVLNCVYVDMIDDKPCLVATDGKCLSILDLPALEIPKLQMKKTYSIIKKSKKELWLDESENDLQYPNFLRVVPKDEDLVPLTGKYAFSNAAQISMLLYNLALVGVSVNYDYLETLKDIIGASLFYHRDNTVNKPIVIKAEGFKFILMSLQIK